MDLNLAEQAGVPDAATLGAGVMDVLKQIVSAHGGPYLLVFWTQIGTRVEEVSRLLFERLERIEGIPCPIAITQLPKGLFIIGDPGEGGFKPALQAFYATLHANIDALRTAVATAVAHDTQLSAMSLWESRASDAAASAVNEVYKCAREESPDPLERGASIQKVLAKVAAAASGDTLARAAPGRALDSGLSEILVDQLDASAGTPGYQEAVQRAIGPTLQGAITFRDEASVFAGLNTFFHLDTEVAGNATWDRGAVILARPPLDRNVLGFNANELITSEFLFPHELFPPDRHDSIRNLLAEFRQGATVVLVEVGADCDHAQDHDRTRRFLVGLEVPNRFLELTKYFQDGKLRNESLQLLGPWKIEDDVRYLLVSCRRFWAWQKRTPPPQLGVRYRLRASVVDKLLHHYSVWSSRPGIVEFR